MRLYGLSNSTAATGEPVTVAQARKHVELPANYSAHDQQLATLITAARERVEMLTGRQIMTATWDLYLDQWPHSGIIELPKPPLQSVTSVTYVDLDGATQTWSSANYVANAYREPGTVRLAYGVDYPSARYQPDSIRVRYVAGYSSAALVPSGLKAAILLLVGHWFHNRIEVVVGTITAEVPTAAAALCQQFTAGDEFVDYAGVC